MFTLIGVATVAGLAVFGLHKSGVLTNAVQSVKDFIGQLKK